MAGKSLNIALMSSQKNWGGGEQLLFSLGESLIRLGHRILWVAPRSSRLMERVRQAGMNGFEIANRHPSPVTILRLRNAIKRNRIHILHGNDTHAISWGSMLSVRRESTRLVGVKHTIFPVTSAAKYNWLVDRMVCVSRAVREVCLDGGILSDRLSVVYGGIAPPEVDRRAARLKACSILGIGLDVPLICAVGSLIPCKGYDTLVEAAHRLRARLNDFRIVICGEGPMRPKIEAMIRERGLEDRVVLMGFCENPTEWIASADLFVHPSRSEGLSLVSIEAQMVGTPMVVSEVGGLREVVRCQDTSRPLGWIFATSDPSDLAGLLENALDDQMKRQQTIQDAQQSALRHFTLDRMVNGFLDVYGSLHAETLPSTSEVRRAA